MNISVVMAAYNGARFIETQLQSIMNQTRAPDEIVISDDNSTDETIRIVESIIGDSKISIKVIRSSVNCGYSENFQRAILACSGDLVMLSDQDDYWFPRKVAVIEQIFLEYRNIMVIINDQIISDAALQVNGNSIFENSFALGYDDSWLSAGCCTSFRSEMIELFCPFPSDLLSYDSWIAKISHGLGVRYICREKLQLYRRHGLNASASVASGKLKVSFLDRLRVMSLKDVQKGWQNEIQVNIALISRLSYFLNIEHSFIPKDSISRFLSSIIVYNNRLSLRSQLVRQPRWRRCFYLTSFYLNGNYDSFSGLRSYIKDLIRP
jgi:glycosyltransferase involved in cell wall biosynthesis